MKFTRPISRKSLRHDRRFKCPLYQKALASKLKPLPLRAKAHRAGKALATLLAKIDIVRSHGGLVTAVGVIVDRSGPTKPEFDCPFVSLIEMNMETFSADQIPPD